MERIGFICDIRMTTGPRKVVGFARLQRVVPMASALREHGIEVFAYSRYHFNPDTGLAFGYVVGETGFTPLVAPVPRINGNWFLGTHRTRNVSGRNLRRFTEWTRSKGIDVYPPREFLRLTLDKYKSFRSVAEYDPGLSPHTELYTGEPGQLDRFLTGPPSVFLKPRFGSQGEGVIVLGRTGDGWTASHYAGTERSEHAAASLVALRDAVDEIVGDVEYVIQEGVDVKRHGGAASIVRVIMLHDGHDWHWTHKLVMSTGSGDVANTSQGGVNYTIEEALPMIFGDDATAACITDELRRVSFEFAAHLDRAYPAQLPELAFDFILDAHGRPYLGEFDVQPGVMKPGMNVDRPFADFFDIRPEEQALWDKYVVPHAACLAGFFRSKLGPALSG